MSGLPYKTVPILNYMDNHFKLTTLFIIGFMLGDGPLHLRLIKSDKGSI
jgi:hypothetical protein